jgi:hypothetical protein
VGKAWARYRTQIHKPLISFSNAASGRLRSRLERLSQSRAFVPAISPKPESRPLPITLGLLRITGATLAGPRPSDFFELTNGPAGDVGVALFDLQLHPIDASAPAEVARSLASKAAQGFQERTPLHAIMLDLSRALLEHPSARLRATLIRFAVADARTEVSIAGMPPIACVLPGGRVNLYGVASQALSRATSAPPPVEVVPLIWASTWLAVSDGFSGDFEHAHGVRELARQLELGDEGLLLSQQSPDALRSLLTRTLPAWSRDAHDDATLLLIAADPSARSESGIQRGTQATPQPF